MEARSFWFHYNKPESRKQGCNILTIHCGGLCHLVSDIECQVPVYTRHRKSQPYCVMAGRGVVFVTDGKAVILGSKQAGK
jgi:hypothetical protein